MDEQWTRDKAASVHTCVSACTCVNVHTCVCLVRAHMRFRASVHVRACFCVHHSCVRVRIRSRAREL